MRKITIGLAFIIVLMGMTICNAQNNIKASFKDFDQLIGSWQGSLTYLDYKSGKPYTMSANLEIRRLEKSHNFIFSNIYPKESNANSSDTFTFSKDGKYINNEIIKSGKKLANGKNEIITEISGKDGNDNKPAIIRHTYTFNKYSFSKRKDVQFAGGTEWIRRNEYTYQRKKISN